MSVQQFATLCSIVLFAFSQKAKAQQNPIFNDKLLTPQYSQNVIRHETSPNCVCTTSQCICSQTITIQPSISQRKVYLKIDYNQAGNPLFHIQLDGTKGTIIRGDVSAPPFKLCRRVSALHACVQLNDVTVPHSISGCVRLIIQVGTSSSTQYDLGCFHMTGSNAHLPKQPHINFAAHPTGPLSDPFSTGTGHYPSLSANGQTGSNAGGQGGHVNKPDVRASLQYENGIWNCPRLVPSCEVVTCSPRQPCPEAQVCLFDSCNRRFVCASVQRKCLATTPGTTTLVDTTATETTIATGEPTEPIEIEPTEAPEPTEVAPV